MDRMAFWDGVARYNEALWPVQAVMLAMAAYLTLRIVVRPGATTDVLVKAFLAFAFAWNGIVVLLVYLGGPISVFVGLPLFTIVAGLFAVDIFTGLTSFRFPPGRWARAFTVVWLGLALLYPALGWPLGHTYPRVLFPLFPCPLTVFAIALVAAAVPDADVKVFLALLPWGLLALPKAFGALDCYEDWVLFGAGVYGLVVLIKNWRYLPWRRKRSETVGSAAA